MTAEGRWKGESEHRFRLNYSVVFVIFGPKCIFDALKQTTDIAIAISGAISKSYMY